MSIALARRFIIYSGKQRGGRFHQPQVVVVGATLFYKENYIFKGKCVYPTLAQAAPISLNSDWTQFNRQLRLSTDSTLINTNILVTFYSITLSRA